MQLNFLSEENRLERLSKMGDPLEKVSKYINFEEFRFKIEEAIRTKKKDPKLGGRPPMDVILMWKMSLLQQWYGISNDNVEYMTNDRLSFQRFLGLGLSDKVPDANTLWDFKEALAQKNLDKELFEIFEKKMEEIGVITRAGSLVDASFVDVPRQRISKEEKKILKEKEIPDRWLLDGNGNELSQRDAEATWAKKGQEVHFGYKDHVKVDTDSKMIVNFEVTTASVHDSQKIVDLCDEKDNVVNADTAYVGKELEQKLKEKCGQNIILKINEKAYRNKPLTDEQKESNKEKSRVRARVEHVFGFMTMSMGGMFMRTIGITRAKAEIARRNLAYNFKRFVYLASIKPMTT